MFRNRNARRPLRQPAKTPAASAPALPGGWTLDLGQLGQTGSPLTAWANQGSAGGTFTALATAEPTSRSVNSLACPLFDGSNDFMSSTLTVANVLDADGYHGFCVLDLDAIDAGSSSANPYNQINIIADSGGYFCLGLRNNAGALTVNAYQYVASDIKIGATLAAGLNLIEWWYDNTNLNIRVNNDAVASVAGGNLSSLTGTLLLGRNYAATFRYLDGAICRLLLDDEVRTSDSATVRAALAGIYSPGAWT